MIKCCREGCNNPSIITFHLEGHDIAKCGCIEHWYDMAWQFENEVSEHDHFRYLLYCEECKDLKHHSQVTAPSMKSPSTCILHPEVLLIHYPLSADKLFKECVEPTEVINHGNTN